MKKPRRRGAPRVRQVNGCRFVVQPITGGWSARCRYSDRFGTGHRFFTIAQTGHASGMTARRLVLESLHDAMAPKRTDERPPGLA